MNQSGMVKKCIIMESAQRFNIDSDVNLIMIVSNCLYMATE